MSESATLNAGLVSCVVFISNIACEDNLFQPIFCDGPELLEFMTIVHNMHIYATNGIL